MVCFNWIKFSIEVKRWPQSGSIVRLEIDETDRSYWLRPVLVANSERIFSWKFYFQLIFCFLHILTPVTIISGRRICHWAKHFTVTLIPTEYFSKIIFNIFRNSIDWHMSAMLRFVIVTMSCTCKSVTEIIAILERSISLMSCNIEHIFLCISSILMQFKSFDEDVDWRWPFFNLQNPRCHLRKIEFVKNWKLRHLVACVQRICAYLSNR